MTNSFAFYALSAGVFASTALAMPAVAETMHVPLKALSGSSVSGSVDFTETKDGMDVKVSVAGLTPGEHGFHIHENGDCNAVDGSSAGPHFNPLGKQHGGPHSADRHAGDLGNITADASGRAETTMKGVALTFEGERGIRGRSVLVHEGRDDLSTDPAGDSGKRIACGEIGKK